MNDPLNSDMSTSEHLTMQHVNQLKSAWKREHDDHMAEKDMNQRLNANVNDLRAELEDARIQIEIERAKGELGVLSTCNVGKPDVLVNALTEILPALPKASMCLSACIRVGDSWVCLEAAHDTLDDYKESTSAVTTYLDDMAHDLHRTKYYNLSQLDMNNGVTSELMQFIVSGYISRMERTQEEVELTMNTSSFFILPVFSRCIWFLYLDPASSSRNNNNNNMSPITSPTSAAGSIRMSNSSFLSSPVPNIHINGNNGNRRNNYSSSNNIYNMTGQSEEKTDSTMDSVDGLSPGSMMTAMDLQSLLQLLEERAALLSSGWFSILETTSQLVMSSFVQRLNQINMDRSVLVSTVLNHVNNHLFHVHNMPIVSEPLSFTNCGLVAPSIRDAEKLWSDLCPTLKEVAFQSYDLDFYFTVKYVDAQGQYSKLSLLSSSFTEAYELENSDATVISQVVAKGVPLFSQFPLERREEDNIDIIQMEVDLGDDENVQSIYAIPVFLPPVLEESAKDGLVPIAIDDKNVLSFLGCVAVFRSKELKLSRVERENLLVAVQAVSSTMTAWLETHIQLFNPLYAPTQSGQPLHGRNRMQKSITGGTIADVTTGLSSTVRGVSFSSVGGSVNLQQQSSVFLPSTSIHESIQQHAVSITSLMASVLQQCLEEGESGVMNKAVCLSACLRVLPAYLDADWVMPILIEKQNLGGQSVSTYYLLASDGSGDRVPLPDVGSDLQSLIEWLVNAKVNSYEGGEQDTNTVSLSAARIVEVMDLFEGGMYSSLFEDYTAHSTAPLDNLMASTDNASFEEQKRKALYRVLPPHVTPVFGARLDTCNSFHRNYDSNDKEHTYGYDNSTSDVDSSILLITGRVFRGFDLEDMVSKMKEINQLLEIFNSIERTQNIFEMTKQVTQSFEERLEAMQYSISIDHRINSAVSDFHNAMLTLDNHTREGIEKNVLQYHSIETLDTSTAVDGSASEETKYDDEADAKYRIRHHGLLRSTLLKTISDFMVDLDKINTDVNVHKHPDTFTPVEGSRKELASSVQLVMRENLNEEGESEMWVCDISTLLNNPIETKSSNGGHLYGGSSRHAHTAGIWQCLPEAQKNVLNISLLSHYAAKGHIIHKLHEEKWTEGTPGCFSPIEVNAVDQFGDHMVLGEENIANNKNAKRANSEESDLPTVTVWLVYKDPRLLGGSSTSASSDTYTALPSSTAAASHLIMSPQIQKVLRLHLLAFFDHFRAQICSYESSSLMLYASEHVHRGGECIFDLDKHLFANSSLSTNTILTKNKKHGSASNAYSGAAIHHSHEMITGTAYSTGAHMASSVNGKKVAVFDTIRQYAAREFHSSVRMLVKEDYLGSAFVLYELKNALPAFCCLPICIDYDLVRQKSLEVRDVRNNPLKPLGITERYLPAELSTSICEIVNHVIETGRTDLSGDMNRNNNKSSKKDSKKAQAMRDASNNNFYMLKDKAHAFLKHVRADGDKETGWYVPQGKSMYIPLHTDDVSTKSRVFLYLPDGLVTLTTGLNDPYLQPHGQDNPTYTEFAVPGFLIVPRCEACIHPGAFGDISGFLEALMSPLTHHRDNSKYLHESILPHISTPTVVNPGQGVMTTNAVAENNEILYLEKLLSDCCNECDYAWNRNHTLQRGGFVHPKGTALQTGTAAIVSGSDVVGSKGKFRYEQDGSRSINHVNMGAIGMLVLNWYNQSAHEVGGIQDYSKVGGLKCVRSAAYYLSISEIMKHHYNEDGEMNFSHTKQDSIELEMCSEKNNGLELGEGDQLIEKSIAQSNTNTLLSSMKNQSDDAQNIYEGSFHAGAGYYTEDFFSEGMLTPTNYGNNTSMGINVLQSVGINVRTKTGAAISDELGHNHRWNDHVKIGCEYCPAPNAFRGSVSSRTKYGYLRIYIKMPRKWLMSPKAADEERKSMDENTATSTDTEYTVIASIIFWLDSFVYAIPRGISVHLMNQARLAGNLLSAFVLEEMNAACARTVLGERLRRSSYRAMAQMSTLQGVFNTVLSAANVANSGDTGDSAQSLGLGELPDRLTDVQNAMNGNNDDNASVASSTLDIVNSGLDGDYVDAVEVDSKNGIAMDSHLGLSEARYMKETLDAVSAVCAALATTLRQVLDERTASSQARRKMAAITVKVRKEKSAAWSFIEQAARILLPSSYEHGYHGLISKSIYSNYHTGVAKEIDHLSHAHFNGNDIFDQQVCVFEPKVFNKFLILMDIMSQITGRLLNTCVTFSLREDASRLVIDSCNDKIYSQPYMKTLMEDMPKNQKQILNQDVVIWCDHNAPPERLPHNNYLLRPDLLLTAWQKCAPVKALLETASRVNSDGHSEIIGQLVVEYMPVGAKNPDVVDISKTATVGDVGVTIGGKAYLPAQWEVNTQYPLAIIQYISLVSTADKVKKAKSYRSAGKGGDVRLRRHKKKLRKQMSRGTFAMSDDESEASDVDSDDDSGIDTVSDTGNINDVFANESTEHEEMVHLIQEWAVNNFKKMQLPQLIALPDDNSVEGEEEEMHGEGMYGHQHTHEYAVSRTLEALLERCEEPYDVSLLHDPTHISRSKHDGEVHNIHFADAWMNFSTAASAYFASKLRGDSTFMYPFHQMYTDETEEEQEMRERVEKGMEQQLLGVRTRWKLKQVDHYKSAILHKNEFNSEGVEKLEDGVVIISREKLHHIHIEAKRRGQIHYFDDDGIEVFGPMEMHHVFTDEPESHLLGVSFRITGNTSGMNAHASDEKYLSEMSQIRWMIIIQIDRIINREDIFTAHSVTLLLQKLITQRILRAKYDKIFSMTQHLHSNLSIRNKTSEQLRDMWRFYDDMHKSIRMCVWDTGRAMRILYDGVSGQLPHLIGSFSAEVMCAEDLVSEMEGVVLNSGKKKSKNKSGKKTNKSDEDFIRQCVMKDRMIEENPLDAANKSRAASPLKGSHPIHTEEHHYSHGHHTEQHTNHRDSSGAEHIRRKQHGRKLIFWIPLFKTSSHRTLTNTHASSQDVKCYWALKVLVEPHTPLANALKTDEGLNEKFNQFLMDEAKRGKSDNMKDPTTKVVVKEKNFANASEAVAAIETAEASAANSQQAPVSSVSEEKQQHHGHHHHVHSIVDKSFDEAHGNVHFENLCFAIKAIRSDLTIISLERAVQNDARLQQFYRKVDGTIDSTMQSFALMLHNGDESNEEISEKTNKRASVSWNDMGETNYAAEQGRKDHENASSPASSTKDKQVAEGELLDTMGKFSVTLNESMYMSDQATRLRWEECAKEVFKDNNAFSGVSSSDSQADDIQKFSGGSVASTSSPSKPGAPGTPDRAAHDHIHNQNNAPYMIASDIAEQNTFRDDLCSLRARLHWVEQDAWQTTQYAEEIEKERLFRKMQRMQKRKLHAAQLTGAGNIGIHVGGNDMDVQAFLNEDSDDEDEDDNMPGSVLSFSKKNRKGRKKGNSLEKRCKRLQTPSNLSQSFLEEVIQSNSVQQQTLMRLHPSASNIRISRVRSSRDCKPLEYVLKKNKKRLQELGLDDGSVSEYSSSDSDSDTDAGDDELDDATNDFEHDHFVAHVYLDVGVVGQKAVLEVLISFCPLYLYPMSQLTGQYGYTHEVESYLRQCIFNSCQEGALMGLRIYMCNSIQLLHKTKHSAGTYDVLNEAIFLARSQSRVLGQALGELCRDEKFNAITSEGIKEAVNDYFLYMLDRVSLQLMHLNGVLGITLTVWDTTRSVELYKKRACMSNDGTPIVQDLNKDVAVGDNPQTHFVDDTLLGYSSEYTFECGEITGVMAFFWDKHDPFNVDLPQINEKSHSQAALSLQEHKHTHHDDTSAIISAFVKALSRRIFELYRGHRNSQLLAIQQKTIINVKADLTLKAQQLEEALRKFEAAATANDDLATKVDGLKSQLRVERQINAEAIHSRNSMADKAMKITAAMRAEHAREVSELKDVYVKEHEAMAVDIGQRDAVINVLREEEAKLYHDNVEARKALSSSKKQIASSIKQSIKKGDIESIQHILFSDNEEEGAIQAPPPSMKIPAKKVSQRDPVDKDNMFHVTEKAGERESHHHSHRSHRSHKSSKTGAPDDFDDDDDIRHLPDFAGVSARESRRAHEQHHQSHRHSHRSHKSHKSHKQVPETVMYEQQQQEEDDDDLYMPAFAGGSRR